VAGVELHAAAMAALAAGGPLRPISTGSASVAGAAAAVVAAVLVLAAPGRWARRRLVTAALAGIAATITACALLAVLAGLWWSPLPALAGLGAAFVTELVRRWLKQRLAPHPPQAGAGLVPVSTGDGAPTTDPAPHLPSVGAATRAITRRSPD
jgi:CHASE2 domain-containing sensor protein